MLMVRASVRGVTGETPPAGFGHTEIRAPVVGEVASVVRVKDPGEEARERARDEAVLRGVLEQGEGAFDGFVERFGNRIYAFGMRMCGHREDAEDVFQETLVSVYRKLETLREPGALTTWLYRIVANTCLPRAEESLRPIASSRRSCFPRRSSRGPVLPDPGDPSSDLYRLELSRALEEAVRDLPPDFRVVWLMRDVEGLSTEETAEALGLSIPGAKMRLHRARLALRKRLAPFQPERGSA
jgi:RNA polymerase sigma-70 factor (ECF subfamily)